MNWTRRSLTFVEPVGGDGSQSGLVDEALAFAVDVFVSPMRVADEGTITDEMNSWRSIHVKLRCQHLLFGGDWDRCSQEVRRALWGDTIYLPLTW